MTDKPKPVQALLGGTALTSIRAELEAQARLLQALRDSLPDALGEHCRHCVAKNDRLTIYVDSPAWSSQLRFYGPSLLTHLEQSVGYRFKNIQIHNLLRAQGAGIGPVKPPLVPPVRGVSEILRQNADSSPPEIKEALLKLSRAIDSARGIDP
jgi:hypothetical protein